jgi:hypothetical protein
MVPCFLSGAVGAQYHTCCYGRSRNLQSLLLTISHGAFLFRCCFLSFRVGFPLFHVYGLFAVLLSNLKYPITLLSGHLSIRFKDLKGFSIMKIFFWNACIDPVQSFVWDVFVSKLFSVIEQDYCTFGLGNSRGRFEYV